MTTDSTTPTTPDKRQEFAAALAERFSGKEAAYLIEQLDEAEAALRAILPRSSEAALTPSALPDTIVLPFGYEAPRIVAEGDVVSGPTMLERAKEANAVSGKAECEDFLAHQAEIPVECRGKIVFVFTEWRHPGRPGCVAIVFWGGDCWVQYWRWLAFGWNGHHRPVRRST